MSLDGTTAGLWLVGVGSLLAAIPRLIRAPRPELGLSWESMARLVERIHAAFETVGLVTVAAGSVVLAIAELGPWWFEAGVVMLACASVYVVSAYKLRQLWHMRANTVQDDTAIPAILTVVEQCDLALDRARWRSCLRYAFSRTPSWPPTRSIPANQGTETDKLVPRHISELHESDARLADLHIPPSISAEVDAIRAHGFTVSVVGDLIVATAPDGRQASVSRSLLQANAAGTLLARQRFLDDLQKLGLPVRPGPKGQPRVDL
jgi:hypothetical protein